MNEAQPQAESYLTCEINGSQYILQTVPSSPEAFINVENLDEDSVTFAPDVVHLKSSKAEAESEAGQTIPLVCLDGQIYAVQNGQLQELNLSSVETEALDNQVFQRSPQKPAQTITETSKVPCKTFTRAPEAARCKKQEFAEKEELNANDILEVVTAFKCKICPYTTQDRAELLSHFRYTHANPTASPNLETPDQLKIDDVKLLYMCGECSNCFPSMETCREHMIKDHQLTDRTSDAPSKEALISEIQTNPEKKSPKPNAKKKPEGKEKTIKCKYRGCVHKFSTEQAMQKHAACHIESSTVNSFRCTICMDVKFPKWKMCSMHLWKKHQIDIDLLSCEICKNYKSATMVKLLTHMRVHSDNRDYECPDCGKRFKQPSQLRNHRVMHLDRKSVDIPRWYTSKTCEMCGKTYADSKCLKNHMQAVHSKLRPYVCNVCGHSSARKAMLQMHLRQHTGDKPFNCDICEFKTGDHNSLRRHVMRHTGVRPYKCPHCSYSAIQSSSYKNHLKAKHPTSSGFFTCELCSFKTVKKESYLEHVGDHEKGLIKSTAQKEKEKETSNVEVFPGNIAAAQLIYSCLGAFSKVGKTIEASLMSSSTSADGTSQTITIQIPSKHLEGSLPITDNPVKNSSIIEQEDDETMHCFLKIPREEEENIDTGGITIPAEPEDVEPQILNVES